MQNRHVLLVEGIIDLPLPGAFDQPGMEETPLYREVKLVVIDVASDRMVAVCSKKRMEVSKMFSIMNDY
mgnify:FL=1